MRLPNIWGQGALFAFSGLEGECRVHGCINAALLGDLLGVRIHSSEMFDLYVLLDGIKDIEYEVVASDVIRATLRDAQGLPQPVIFTFLNQNTIVGLCGRGRVQLRSLRQVPVTSTVQGSVYRSGNSSFHFWKCDIDGISLFSFSTQGFQPVSQAQVNELAQRRVDWLSGFDALAPRDEEIRLTFLKCVSVMKSQVYTADGQFNQRWTTPNRLPHRWLWLWDSAFHALGNYILDEGLAQDTLQSVMDVQKEDGFIPHLARPSFTSDITQPPILCWSALKLFKRGGDRGFLGRILPGLEKYLAWNEANRTIPATGLFMWHVNTTSTVCRADESGMDNSPRFDGVGSMECIDFSCFMLSEYQCIASLCDAAAPERAEDYRLKAKKLKQAINRYLWDEADKFYYDRLPESGDLHKVSSIASFLPLFAGACSARAAALLVRHLDDPASFATELPIPSVARCDVSFGTDMWRGPVWLNYNYMIAEGLRRYGYQDRADALILKTLRAVCRYYMEDGVIYEMYDPDGRVSPRCLRRKGAPIEPYDPRVRYQAIRDYGWSSALFAAMVMENSGCCTATRSK